MADDTSPPGQAPTHADVSAVEFGGSRQLRILNTARHLVPLALRPRLRDFVFRMTRPAWTRPSGIRLRVIDDNDWTHYTEIFRKGEYDQAIRLAIDGAQDAATLMVVDLGANLGFFTLRVEELMRQSLGQRSARIVAVEGSPLLAPGFRERVLQDNGLYLNVRFVAGLVGGRTGNGTLYLSGMHGDSSIFRPGGSPVDLPYVDLDQLLGEERQIDLLKCDIEGAELMLIATYRELLQKVRVAVVEMHAELCDTQVCRDLLKDYGFTNARVQRHTGAYSLECFWK